MKQLALSDDQPELTMSVSEFVALLNQTLEFAYPNVTVTGELANFRVSKNRWVYFDIKDEFASVRCFGTVYQLPGPLGDGMLLQVRAQPRLHPQYGFSLNIMSLRPAGKGSIKKAAALLEAKLAAEGLFDDSRKRPLPYPPVSIGLVTSGESAAYADFLKILRARWGGVDVRLTDVQVQGEAAPAQLVQAIEQLNALATPPDVIVVTRGGGSAEDLQAFSTEQVTRAVAASRVPTLVAIGHEIDLSLAELAADSRASTPSNAAELLVPDKHQVLAQLHTGQAELQRLMLSAIADARHATGQQSASLSELVAHTITARRVSLQAQRQLLAALSPQTILQRGYAVVQKGDAVVRQATELAAHDTIRISFADGSTRAIVTESED